MSKALGLLIQLSEKENVLDRFKAIVNEFETTYKRDFNSPEVAVLVDELKTLKKPILLEFSKFLEAYLKQKKGKTDASGYFLGSLSYYIDEEFTKLLFKKEFPTWQMIYGDRIFEKKLRITTRDYNTAFKNAFDNAFGKGSYKIAKDANKKIR